MPTRATAAHPDSRKVRAEDVPVPGVPAGIMSNVPQTGVIVVQRERAFRFFLAPFKIFIDGEAKGSVRNGKERRFVVSAGHHQVRVKIDWQGSRQVDAEVPVAGAVTLVCGPTRDPLAATRVADRNYEAIVLKRG